MVGHPSPDRNGNSAIECGGSHQLDDVVVRRVDDRHHVDGQDFVTGPQSSVQIGCTTRNDVTDRDLRPFLSPANDPEAEPGFVP